MTPNRTLLAALVLVAAGCATAALALSAAREIRFTPALYEGQPQEVQIAFTITFRAR